MLALPVSMVVSLALAFLVAQALASGRRRWPIPTLLAACAAQGVIITLSQYYHVPGLHHVQPVTATLIPPLAWIAFQATMVRPFEARRDLPHLAVPAFTAFCTAFAPATLDLVVPGVFTIYGLLLTGALRRGADGLPLGRLEAGDQPRRVWQVVTLALLLSAAGDWVIAMAWRAGAAWLTAWVITVVSSLSLLLVGALGVAGSLEGEDEAAAAPPRPPDRATDRDGELMAGLDRLLAEQRLFLDPDLTLARLARRLGVPAKQLSAAINRSSGGNVSRYVNALRIRHACGLLASGQSVTAAMLASGFNTKSNFQREFQRVTGGSPSQWAAEAAAEPPGTLPPALRRMAERAGRQDA